MTTPAPRPSRRLFWKYVWLLVVLLGAALTVSACLEIYYSYHEHTRALLRLQEKEALAAAGRIEQFVADVERRIAPLVEAQWDVSIPQLTLDYLRLLREVPAISEVSHLDASGREQLRLSRLALDVFGSQRDLSADQGFLAAKSGKTYFSPVHFREESEPYMKVAVAGAHGSVAMAEVDLKRIWDVVSRIKIGKAGRAQVVDSAGLLIAHPDISLVLRKTNLAAMPQVRDALGRPDRPFEEVATIARDRDGRRILTASVPIPLLGWTVFVEQPLGEAFEPVYASIVRTGVIGLVALGLSVLASVFLARRIVRPIQALQRGADRLGAGALDERIAVSSGDELGALAGSFNRMAAQLQEAYGNLEDKVEARTRELARAVQELRALGEVGRALSSTLDLDTVLHTIVSRANQLAGTDGCTVYEYDEGTEEFTVRATENLHEDVVAVARRTPIRRGEGAVGRTAITREPLQIADIGEANAYDGPLRDVLLRTETRALLAIPLLHEHRLLGGLTVNRKTPGAFAPETVELLQTFATQSALAIQNARLFRELEDKSRQLEIASHHKSDFLANVSHELRTPMNAILGFNEMILGEIYGDVPDDLRGPLTDIQNSGKHLLRLINNVLDLSKIEAGRMELALADYAVQDTVESVRASLAVLAAQKGLALTVSVPGDIPLVHGDGGRITQCLLNLAGNALKFTREGRVTITVVLLDDVLEFRIADTGIGIAADRLEAVFGEFRQSDATIASEFGGTGLGLSITRKFVELHGGRLWVESTLGTGSTFIFTIPLRAEAATTV